MVEQVHGFVGSRRALRVRGKQKQKTSKEQEMGAMGHYAKSHMSAKPLPVMSRSTRHETRKEAKRTIVEAPDTGLRRSTTTRV